MVLYEGAMQVVPVLLIALFIEPRTIGRSANRTKRRWANMQDRVYAALGAVAFTVSMLVVAGVATAGRGPAAIVIATLSGCMGLLYARIEQRFVQDHGQQHDNVSGDR
ncbi:hypothetical protein ABTW72_03040 [Micromonospora sp. NPDC127501]|uniref:hypothetical protein n=1 Tax=Micromonospora sp. NPDC127501 TaxID=3154872 RepID=UPI0033200ED9